MIGVVVCLVLVLFLAWIYARKGEDPVLQSLKRDLERIAPDAPEFTLVEDLESSFLENKERIHLVLKRTDGTSYERDVLLSVAIHELAHLLTEEEGHTKRFYREEARLYKEARRLGILEEKRVDKEYPCKDD